MTPSSRAGVIRKQITEIFIVIAEQLKKKKQKNSALFERKFAWLERQIIFIEKID